MKKKHKYLYYYLLTFFLVALILTTFLLPIVKFSAIDNNGIEVANGTFNLLSYLQQTVYLTTDAYYIFFNGGPVWIAVLAISLNFLIVAFTAVCLGLCIFELITKDNKNITAKQNNLTKRIALFVGYFTLICQIITIVSFLITTAVSNGHATYISRFQSYVGIALAVAIIVIGHLLKKDDFYQKDNKKTAMWGFAGSAVSALICISLIFVPQISKLLLGADLSLFEFSQKATYLVGNTAPYGDYPVGFMFYVIIAILLISAFIIIYSIIGFIKASKGQNTTWLSARIKRWSMAFIITNTIMFALALGGICSITSTPILEGNLMFLFTMILNMVLIFAPYVFATIVPLNKKLKNVKNKYVKL